MSRPAPRTARRQAAYLISAAATVAQPGRALTAGGYTADPRQPDARAVSPYEGRDAVGSVAADESPISAPRLASAPGLAR